MSKDLTQKLNGSLEDKVDRLIAAVQSMGSQIQSMGSQIQSMDSRIQSMDSRIQSIELRVESIDSRLTNVEEGLGNLEKKVEDRLRETRPMWEFVQAQLLELRESQERLRAEMEKGFRVIDRRLEIQPIELSRLHGYQRDLEERVEKIEKRLK